MAQNEETRLLVVGCGALANALLPRIMRMGWARISLMDGDRVEVKNLERQELFAPVDVGRPKSAVLAAWLRHMPVAVELVPVDAFIGPDNAVEWIAQHDAVADCTDDAHAKLLIDRTCAAEGKVLVSGSVHGAQAQVLTLHAQGAQAELDRSTLFGGKPGVGQDGCDMRHVPLGTLHEAARCMAGHLAAWRKGKSTNGRIDLFDGRAWTSMAPPRG